MKLTLLNEKPAILSDSGETIIYNITCGIRYDGPTYYSHENMAECQWKLEENAGDTIVSNCFARIVFKQEENGICFTTEFMNQKEAVPGVKDFIVMRGYFSEHFRKILGNTLVKENENRIMEMRSAMETMVLLPGQGFESGDFIACNTVSDRNYILGFLTHKEYFGSVYICEDGTFEVRQFPELHPMGKGEIWKSDIFYLTECKNIVTELLSYSDLVVKYMVGVPRNKFDVSAGYCTWYYYLRNICENTVTNAVEDMAAYRDELPVKYIQIDAGWERAHGQWDANEKFPSDMKACADKIKEAGFLPGLWFGLRCAEDTEVYRRHPEYFAKQRDSDRATTCFDFSVEETCQFVGGLFRKFTYEWGYRYLKLDFITPALGVYRFKDPAFNSIKNYRRFLEVVNESVPQDTFILACTAPIGSAVGLVDGMRISGDIFGHWQSVCTIFCRILKRYYYHKRFFINDADCLIIRKAENEDDECYRSCTRNDDEIKTFISVIAASGGTLMFSDKIRLLAPDQIRSMSYLFPLNTDAALPLDLMDTRMPGVLDNGLRGKIRTVMLINWDNVPKTMSVETGYSHVYEFWTSTYKGVVQHKYENIIQPHCCEVLFITSADSPAVIGTDSVLIPVIDQTFEDDILSATFIKKNETFFIAANCIEGNGCIIKEMEKGLYAVRQTGENMRITLKCMLK